MDMEVNILPVSWSLDWHDYQRRAYSAKFEWVTGMLEKAMENVEWIVLENADLCNPTVLDRINSLVEPCGSITVNECASVDDKPLVLRPHLFNPTPLYSLCVPGGWPTPLQLID